MIRRATSPASRGRPPVEYRPYVPRAEKEEVALSGAADGFNVMPAALPSGLEAFVEHVIPLLRQRGVFRTEYTGRTLREHYGIPRPENVFTAARPAARADVA